MAAWPAALPRGGGVSVWAPSSPGPQLFPDRFARAVAALREDGFRVRLLPSCGAAEGVSTLPPAALAAELHTELLDPDCHAVIAAVGGWTLLRVLPYLDLELIASAGKPLVGHSDITPLINLVGNRAGLVAFHGPMVLSEWGDAEGAWAATREEFHAVLGVRGPWTERTTAASPEWSDEMLWWGRDDTRPRAARQGERPNRVVRGAAGEVVEGTLWGGSLLALALTLGTPLWVQPRDALVLLEAEALAPDELAARLEQLRLAGVFDGASGVLMSRIGRPRATASGYSDYDQVLREVVPAGVPVAAGFDLGHSAPVLTLPVGGRARLALADGDAALTVLGPGSA